MGAIEPYVPGRRGIRPPTADVTVRRRTGERCAHYDVHVTQNDAPDNDATPLELPPLVDTEPAPAKQSGPARRAVVAEDEALIRMDVVETLREIGRAHV